MASSGPNVNYSLICSVRSGNLEIVKELVDSHGLSYSKAWSEGYTLLRDAIESGHVEIAKFLLQKGAKVKSKSKRTGVDTPLHFAVVKKDLELVQMLIDRGAKISARNANGDTPLHVAVESGNEDMVLLLCNNHASSSQDVSNFTPLHIACFKRSPSTVKLLLSKISCSPKCVDTALLIASQLGDLKIVKILLKHGVQVNCSRPLDNFTPLHLAAKKADPQIVAVLLNNGADPNVGAINGTAPLHLAVERGCLEAVELLLNHSADINTQTCKGFSPLLLASKNFCTTIAEVLLKRGADVNASDENGNDPLYFAVKAKNIHLINSILQYKPKVSAKVLESVADSFATPIGNYEWQDDLIDYSITVDREISHYANVLLAAVKGARVKVVKTLLQNGASPKTEGVCSDLLHQAVKKGNKATVRLLLASGWDIDAKDSSGNSPVHYSIHAVHYPVDNPDNKSKYYEIVQLLLDNGASIRDDPLLLIATAIKNCFNACRALIDHGADINFKNKDGQTALHFAAAGGWEDVTGLLIKSGANIDISDNNGVTPLHLATLYGFRKSMVVLLNCGANMNSCQRDGSTPLHIASHTGDSFKVNLLLKLGANVHALTHSSETALHFAAQSRSSDIIGALLDHGADINVEDRSKRTAFLSCKSFQHTAIFKRHAIKLRTAGLYVHEQIKFDMSDPELLSYQKECEEEVEKMKCEKVSCHFSLFDVIRKHRNPSYVRNVSVMTALTSLTYENFPIYKRIILNYLKKSKPRMELLTSGRKCLDILLKTSNVLNEKKLPVLPMEILEEIVFLIDDNGLRELVKCAEDLKRQFSK